MASRVIRNDMNFFQFWAADQKRFNWLIHECSTSGAGWQPKSQYASHVCRKCRRFAHDDVFAAGFEGDIQFQSRSDILCTDDGFFCVNEKFLEVVQSFGFPGLTFKPAGKSGWSVINTTFRFNVTPDVYVSNKEPCDMCNRRCGVMGGVEHLGQFLSTPDVECFFSTTTDKEGSGLSDRHLFVTECVLNALKSNGIKGGTFHLVHDTDDYKRLQRDWRAGNKLRLPKNAKVVL